MNGISTDFEGGYVQLEVLFQGQKYIFNNEQWCDASSYLTPPAVIIHQLNELIKDKLQESDSKITDFDACFKTAIKVRNARNYERAIWLLNKALELKPNTLCAVVLMSSILRDQGKSQQALDFTEPFNHSNDPVLKTTRAGALCDLGRWEEAKKEISTALAIAKSNEAFLVVNRIKANRPELYQKF